MPKTDISVKELVDLISRGELRLPEMQRQYVWPATRVRDLLDSLYRGYPSGSILVWETGQEQPSRDLVVLQAPSPFQGHKLLLDGQQRLTSLSAVIRGQAIRVRNRLRPIDILFNLEHPEEVEEVTEVEDDEIAPDTTGEVPAPEEDQDDQTLGQRLQRLTFVVYSRSLAQDPRWIRVTEVFSSRNDWELLRDRVSSPDDPRYPKYAERLARLRKICDYQYVMQVLERSLSYEEVAEIFVRVNSLGVKLRGSDLALAQITAKWRNSLTLFEEFQEECEEHWFTLDLGILVRTLVVFATKQSKFKTVGSLTEDQLKDAWELAKRGLRFAINFLRSNARIEDETLLSSPMFLIPVAVTGVLKEERLTEAQENALLYWLYVGNAKGHYSRGSTETLLDADLNLLYRQGEPARLLEPLRAQFGRLGIEAIDFEGRNWRSSLYSTAFVALKARGARDWRSGLEISLLHQGRNHFIEAHHVFPKSLLQKAGVEPRLINEVANYAFIGGATNRWISNRSPSEYLPQVVAERGEEELRRHAIPLDPALWEIGNFEGFLQERRALLAAAINGLLDQHAAIPEASQIR